MTKCERMQRIMEERERKKEEERKEEERKYTYFQETRRKAFLVHKVLLKLNKISLNAVILKSVHVAVAMYAKERAYSLS